MMKARRLARISCQLGGREGKKKEKEKDNLAGSFERLEKIYRDGGEIYFDPIKCPLYRSRS